MIVKGHKKNARANRKMHNGTGIPYGNGCHLFKNCFECPFEDCHYTGYNPLTGKHETVVRSK